MESSSTTTSRPASTRRLARSMASSAMRGVLRRRPVEGRRDDLALDRALHVGDLFGPLVDQHDHEVALRVVAAIAFAMACSTIVLPALGGDDDERPLALADRHDQVDDPGGELLRRRSPAAAAATGAAGRALKLRSAACLLGRAAVHRVEAHQRLVALAAADPHGAGDLVTRAQAVLLDLGVGHVGVARAWQVARRAHEGEGVPNVEDAGHGGQRGVAAGRARSGAVPGAGGAGRGSAGTASGALGLAVMG